MALPSPQGRASGWPGGGKQVCGKDTSMGCSAARRGKGIVVQERVGGSACGSLSVAWVGSTWH